MRSFKEIKNNYRFTEEHEQQLSEMKPLMEENIDEVLNTLSHWLLSNKNTARFFDDESRKRHVFGAQRKWFIDLFSGTYDNRFYERLIRIGTIHLKFIVEPHYMNRAINVIRNSCIGILSRTDDPKEIMTNKVIALGKILDISLDVINIAYFEEEIRIYSPVYRAKSFLISFSEKFTQTMNLILVLALIGLTIGVVGMFAKDIGHLFDGDMAHGIISSLGSLLVLWLMIELMNTEIAHLKGGRFRISVFVGVALVAVIRDTMIATLKHERPEGLSYLIAAILVIGIVYWLVTKAEGQQS